MFFIRHRFELLTLLHIPKQIQKNSSVHRVSSEKENVLTTNFFILGRKTRGQCKLLVLLNLADEVEAQENEMFVQEPEEPEQGFGEEKEKERKQKLTWRSLKAKIILYDTKAFGSEFTLPRHGSQILLIPFGGKMS